MGSLTLFEHDDIVIANVTMVRAKQINLFIFPSDKCVNEQQDCPTPTDNAYQLQNHYNLFQVICQYPKTDYFII